MQRCRGDAAGLSGVRYWGLEKYDLEEGTAAQNRKESAKKYTPTWRCVEGEELRYSRDTGYPTPHPLLPLGQGAILQFKYD